MSGSAQNQGTKSQVHSDDVPSSTKSADASSSTDTATATAAEGGSGDNQQDGAGGSERPAASPEPNCAICLGQLENKSFTDSCFHMFCFVCLQEWSKVKAECPLCKQPFKSIIHNVKSYNNYDQFYLDHHHRPSQPLHFGWNFDRSFHYRTTLTMDHRYFNLPDYRVLNDREMTSRQPSVPIYRRSIMPRYRLRSRTVHPLVRPYPEPVSTTNFRRQIYESGRRVSCSGSTHRRRKVSPEFFSANPAQTHRLVPWLNRELNALLYNAEGQVTFVLELIMGLIKRFRIDSDEFYEHIHPYLHHFTRHFIHEFLHFARSPYTMPTYDTKAIYQEPSQTVSSSDSTASSSDVVVVDDDDDEEPSEPHHRRAGTPSPWHSPPSSSVPSTSALARSRWDSPTPGPSWDLSGNSSHSPVNVDVSSDSDASTIIDPAYIAPEASRSQPTRPPSPESSDAEEVIFLSYDKPWEERSPIQLSSGSDSETSYFIKALKQENNKRKKARSLSGVSEASCKSRDRARERSRSPTSPAASHQHSRPQQSSSGHHHGSSVSTSSKSKDRQRKKKSHDKSEETRHSSRSGHREKRKSSHSHISLPLKKRRLNKEGNEDGLEHSTSHKKHKHKKHKNKERRDKRSNRQHDPDDERSGNSLGALEGAASSMSTDRADHCKKHPSGHKKSRVKNTGDAEHENSKEGNSGHHSDSLLSDTSTSSGLSSTTTTNSLTDSDSAPAKRFSRQQRVQQVLQERQRMTHLPQVPTLLDLPSTWENITRLASMLASRSPSQLAPMPGPSQSADDPVVISASSDESDAEDPVLKVRADHMSSDSMPVAKTVVVPCSSNPEIPTPAIDYANTPASTSSASRPLVVDNYIDVESISSEQEMSDLEVVDVESISDSSSELSHSNKASPSLRADPEFADSCAAERALSCEPITSSSVEGTSTASADVRSATGASEMGKQLRILNPCSVAAMKQSRMPRAQKSSSHRKNPFSIDFILGQDVLLGSPSRSALFSRQKSAATRSSQHSSLPNQDVTHSHTQSHLNPRAVMFKSDLSQQEEAVQTPLSSVVDRLARERHAQALTEYTAGQDEEIDGLTDSLSSSLAAAAQPCTEDSPAPPSVSEWGRQSRSPVTPGHSSDTCPPPSPLSQPGSEGPSSDTPASENVDNPYLSPVISQLDTENLSEVCQRSPENMESGDHVKGKETTLSDETVQDSMDQSYASNHNDNGSDLKDFSDEEMDFGCIADRQVRALECSFFEESKEKEMGALSELENSVDFPANDSLKNETDEANVSESQNDVKKLTDDKKCEDEEMDLLKGSVSAEVDEQEEKLLLCEDVNICAPSPSDQEKNTDDHINSVSSSEQNNDCKSHTESENTALDHNQSNSSASQSEVGASSTSSADHLAKDFHTSLAADSKVVSPVAETNPDSSVTTSMQSCPGDVDSSSMVLPAADNEAELLDPCVEFPKPCVRTAEQSSSSPDQESSDLCENSAAQCVLNQDREQPATCDSSLECQANSRP